MPPAPCHVVTTRTLLPVPWGTTRQVVAIEELRSVSVTESEVVVMSATTWRTRFSVACNRSEEHTSELQSLMRNLVCRLLLEKKKRNPIEYSNLISTDNR